MADLTQVINQQGDTDRAERLCHPNNDWRLNADMERTEDWVCIASGPSLTQEDVDYVRGKAKVLAINNAFKVAPWADVLFAADSQWWRTYERQLRGFAGDRWDNRRLQKTPGYRAGNNSGALGICLAYRFGAKRIILLGFDMQNTGGLSHFDGDHPHPLRNPGKFSSFIRCIEQRIAPDLQDAGVELINCTRETALNLRRERLEDAL